MTHLRTLVVRMVICYSHNLREKARIEKREPYTLGSMSTRSTTLREFMFRASVRRLYRDTLKSVRHAPKEMRFAIRDEIRSQIERDALHNARATVQQQDFLLSQGREKLMQLRKMLDLTGQANSSARASTSTETSSPLL